MTAVLPRMLTALGFAASASACVMSTDAVVAERDAMLDDRLVGTWKETDGGDSAVVSRDSGNAYVIAYSSELGTGAFEGRLGRLGDRVVMDFSATPARNEVPDPYQNYLLPLHVLLTVDLAGDTLRVATLEADSLRSALETGRVRLAYGEAHSRVMLHASGDQLRLALGPWLSRPGALTEPSIWRRRPAAISSSGLSRPAGDRSAAW